MDFSWSEYQEPIFSAVATGSGNIVVAACAGSGKTTTIVEGCNRARPGARVSVLAFASRIAETLKRRVRRGTVKTFHGAGRATLLDGLGKHLVFEQYKIGKLCKEQGIYHWGTRGVIEDVVTACKSSLLVNDKADLEGEARWVLIERISNFLDDRDISLQPAQLPPAAEGRGPRALFLDQALQVLERSWDPATTGTFDYADMLWMPIVHQLRPRPVDVLFIDELQDMNEAQLAFGMMVRNASAGRIIAFGDSHQAIFGFAGAKQGAVEWMGSMLEAETFPLPVCYRCAQSIVRLAQHFVPDIECSPDAEEGLVREVGVDHMLLDAAPGDFVLARSNSAVVNACLSLLVEGKRASIAGTELGKGLVAFVENAECESVPEFCAYVEEWKSAEVVRLQAAERNPQSAVDRAECLLAFAQGMSTLENLVARLKGMFVDEKEEHPDRILCSTVHRAKGLEADRVWLLGTSFKGLHKWTKIQAERARTQSEWARVDDRVREENNILYVAITRARKALYCVDGVPQRLSV